MLGEEGKERGGKEGREGGNVSVASERSMFVFFILYYFGGRLRKR